MYIGGGLRKIIIELFQLYYFYIEIEGSLNTNEGKQMLTDIQTYCDLLKVAGIYQNNNK